MLPDAHPTRRRVVFLTGTRADFGKIKPLVRVLEESSRFDVFVFATGMHMEPKYGYTVREIEKCGFSNIFQHINQVAGGPLDRTVAQTVIGFGDYVRLVEPDLVVVHGDRSEALAGALVGALNNVRVAHVEGGEVSGTVDELLRHAVSKLSHLHFVSNEEARIRLVQLGEDPRHVWVIGSPDVDVMNSDELPSLADVRAHYEIPFDRYGVVAWHPVTTEPVQSLLAGTHALIDAMRSSGRRFVVVYPNSDPGSDVILAEYRHQLEGDPHFRVFPSVRFEAMLVLLRHADFVLGNSSMGIREAPYYGVPTVDVGTRQQGRSGNPDLIHAPAERDALLRAFDAADRLRGQLSPRREFGDGRSHLAFRRVLSSDATWHVPAQKRFRDIPSPVPPPPEVVPEPTPSEYPPPA